MSVKKRSLRWLVLTVFMPLLWGCPYESDFPLIPASEAVIDHALIGEWEPVEGQDASPGAMSILPFNERELVIVGTERGKEDVGLLRAISSAVDGELFLSVQEVSSKGPKRWALVNYQVLGDRLFLRIVDEALFSRRFESSSDLRDFVRVQLNNPDLYGSDRIQLWKRVER
ncbi:MAG: hypothetical protein ACUVXD_14525 [Thermodesulfobacteriota bacterium]